VNHRYRVPIRGQDFMTNFESWLACERSAGPAATDPLRAGASLCRGLSRSDGIRAPRFQVPGVHDAALSSLPMGNDYLLSPTNPYRAQAL
jgi:hypothetical protein